MKFSVDARVVDPIHGAGIITEISEQNISGEMHECVVIEIVVGKKRVLVPTESLDDAELRPIVSKAELDDALEELSREPDELPKDWRRRIERLKERVHSGEPKEVAKAIRDIISRSILNKMNPSEKRVLNEAVNVFAGEVALVKNIESDSAKEIIRKHARSGVQKNIEAMKNRESVDNESSSKEATPKESGKSKPKTTQKNTKPKAAGKTAGKKT
ncbi:MAG: hypothetical protein KAQ97_03405 [Candidatus Fermentibacteraceae bacterium]|nr:hypothetical protein [Candidatus Fermentibacteraceae bacterium]